MTSWFRSSPIVSITQTRRTALSDGFPRTLAQAQALDQELKNRGIKLSAVLDLGVNETALLDRIPILRKRCGIVCSAALRRCAFTLLKAGSIGLRSGEYGGR